MESRGDVRATMEEVAMKLTPAEYKPLDALNSVEGGEMPITFLSRSTQRLARKMACRGLLSKRALDTSAVVATALGKRSHARGKS